MVYRHIDGIYRINASPRYVDQGKIFHKASTCSLVALYVLTCPLPQDPPEGNDKSKLFVLLGTVTTAAALSFACFTSMDIRDIGTFLFVCLARCMNDSITNTAAAYFVSGLFVPLFALAILMYWPQRFDLRYGFLSFVLLTWILCIRKPDPKGKGWWHVLISTSLTKSCRALLSSILYLFRGRFLYRGGTLALHILAAGIILTQSTSVVQA